MRMLDIFPEKDLHDVICIYGGSLLETSTFKAGFLTQFKVFRDVKCRFPVFITALEKLDFPGIFFQRKSQG